MVFLVLNWHKLAVVIVSLLVITGCEKAQNDNASQGDDNIADVEAPISSPNEQSAGQLASQMNIESLNQTYEKVDWLALIPQDDLDVLLNPPDYLNDIVDGSAEDQLSSTTQNVPGTLSAAESRYEQALMSTNIIEAMDGKLITIPGFVVPVGFNDEQVITSFFLVPFFGACLHAPPPPPNQIIYVETEQGITMNSLYEPVSVYGKLSTELFEDQIATSAYTMQLDRLTPYDEG